MLNNEQPVHKEIQQFIKKHADKFILSIEDTGLRSIVEQFFLQDCARYFSMVDDMEKSIENNSISTGYASTVLYDTTREILKKGDNLHTVLKNHGRDDLVVRIKEIFRKAGIRWGQKSGLIAHAFLKPRGYAGDYLIIEKIYDNVSRSTGFSYCADQVFLMDDYALAVRSRMHNMKNMLRDYVAHESSGDIRIVNIACGSTREIRSLLEEKEFPSSRNIEFILVDQDSEALDYSRNKIEEIIYGNITVNYVQQSIYEYINRPEKHYSALAGADLVYSIGLADYLPDEAFKNFTSFCFSILKSGGKLVLAHKDSINYNPLSADWWCDWTFNLRNKEEIVTLIQDSGIEDFSLDVEREESTGIILFLKIVKH